MTERKAGLPLRYSPPRPKANNQPVEAIPVYIFQAGYSKEQELEADRDGVKLAVAAGYSSDGAVDMFRRFENLASAVKKVDKSRRQRSVVDLPAEIANVVVLDSLTGYFASHPHSEERRVRIERLIAEQGWKPGPQRALRVRARSKEGER